MIFTGILLFGIISLGKLPQELFPPITYPQLTVFTGYANAAPEEIETIDEKEGKGEKAGKDEKEGKEEKARMSKNQKIILGAAGGLVVAAGLGALALGGGSGGSSGGGGNDDGDSVSPSSP